MSGENYDITGYVGGCDAQTIGAVIAAAIIVLIVVIMFVMGKDEPLELFPQIRAPQFQSLWRSSRGKMSPSLKYALPNLGVD